MRKPIELIATCDGAYLAPLRSAMASCVINNPGERFCLHLLHSTVDEKSLLHMDAYCRYLGVDFCAHGIDRSLFDGAYASKRYPQEVYYRLLAPHVLAEVEGRALYLDPDVLVINPLRRSILRGARSPRRRIWMRRTPLRVSTRFAWIPRGRISIRA